MILTTTPNVEGHQIKDYLGVVAGEAILGTNFFKDFFTLWIFKLFNSSSILLIFSSLFLAASSPSKMLQQPAAQLFYSSHPSSAAIL